MKINREKLISLMTEYGANAKNVADLVCVKPSTVRVWRCKIGRDIPSNVLELLKFKLEKADATKTEA